MSILHRSVVAAVRPAVTSAFSGYAAGAGPDIPVPDIFASGMKGAWYERSNIATLYQESAGITPVAAAGNTVGRGISKDQGLVLGPEVFPQPGFAAATGLTLGTNWSVGGGVATSNGSANGFLQANGTLVVGKTYLAVVELVSRTVGNVSLPYDGFGPNLQNVSVPGVYRRMFAAGGTTLFVAASSLFAGSIDNVSVREVLGNHQVQATAGFRPLYQTGPSRLVFDGDDVLTTTFPAALGTNCTVGRAIPGTGAVITTGVNIGTSFADNVTACALVIFDGPLNAAQTAGLTAYLNQQAVL